MGAVSEGCFSERVTFQIIAESQPQGFRWQHARVLTKSFLDYEGKAGVKAGECDSLSRLLAEQAQHRCTNQGRWHMPTVPALMNGIRDRKIVQAPGQPVIHELMLHQSVIDQSPGGVGV